MEGVYFFNGKDISLNMCIQICAVIDIIAEKYNLYFPDAAYKFYSSHTFEVMEDTENAFWAEPSGYIADRFFEEVEGNKAAS